MKRYIMLVSVVLFFLTASVFFSISCSHSPQGLEGIDSVCFQTQILPLLTNNCGVCHGGSGSKGGRELDFTTYEGIKAEVTPGNARSSKLYSAITTVWLGDQMPPNGPLSLENRTLIKVWIEQGAKNTKCSSTTPGTPGGGNTNPSDTVCFNLDIFPILSTSCGKAGCHDDITAQEGYRINSYQNIVQNSNLVIPGNYAGSKLYKMITKTGEEKMPPASSTQLTQEQINKIKVWIADGALNSNCTVATCDTAGTISFSAKVWPIISGNCSGCHPASGSSNGISLGNYDQVKTVANTLRNSTPVLLGVIKQMSGFKAMPQGGKLDDCKIATIDKWVTQGLANN